MVQDLYGNTVTLPTTLGGGKHRHIGIVMRSFLYAILSHTRYTTTKYLGATPIIPTGSVAAERKIIRMNHMVTLKMFTNHSNVEISVILKAVDG